MIMQAIMKCPDYNIITEPAWNDYVEATYVYVNLLLTQSIE